MAIAGGATSAYICSMDKEGKLMTQPTTTQRSLCVTVDKAIERIKAGERVTVAGGDVTELRRRLE